MGAGPLPADIMEWMGMDEGAAYALLEPATDPAPLEQLNTA